jgi:hypothetical protein
MKLTLLTSQEAERRLSAPAEAQDRSLLPSALAEALREEALAARLVTRTSLLARVGRRLSLEAASQPELAVVLDDLLALGDLVAGPRGQIAPAPARIVELSDGALILLGGVSTAAVREQLGPGVVEAGSPRRLVAPGEGLQARLRSWLEEHGGLWLDVARWSGLSRMPPWRGWLDELEARRALGGDPAEGPASWPDRSLFLPDPRHPTRPRRWREAALTSATTLVRTPREQGWSYGLAWTEEGRVRGFVLSRDEARRTYCALAAAAGCPLVFQEAPEGEDVRLTIEPWLPGAEHRALRLSSEAVAPASPGMSGGYRLPRARWESLRPLIVERTGIVKGND